MTLSADCTAKALTHRIAKIRTIANDNPTSATAQKDEKKTPAKATKSAATPKKSAKVGKKAAAERAAPSSADGGDEYLTPPESVRPKRVGTKRDYAAMNGEGSGTDPEDEEIGEDGLSKKVKIEVGEDIGEGLRSAINEDEYGDGK